ncbi:hypothetical protein QBC45DRAFT_470067 [Copromyces sp. CBS 386.78]|nr:hypothetical protein QBC45DRAFT_470067 [Copromyces sp. CBS 386.78]
MSSAGTPNIAVSGDTLNTTIQQQFKALQTRIVQLEAQLQAGTKTTGAALEDDTPSKDKKKVKLPVPQEFDGQQAALAGFLIQMQTYFYFNEEKFASESEKVAFAGTRLSDRALTWYEPIIKDFYEHGDKASDFTKKIMEDYTEFTDALTRVFREKDETRRA